MVVHPRRLALFVDYQNAYRRCRDALGLRAADHTEGQVDPRKLGRLIASRESETRLERVFVYRGMPDGHKDPRGYAACRRQVAAWRAFTEVEVKTRALQYLHGLPPREKGVDVLLAIDCVRAALADDYDTLAVFSGDSDLAPAVEFVFDQFGRGVRRVCLVAWESGPRIPLEGGRKIWCHNLSRADYIRISDPRDYSVQRPRSTKGNRRS
jgi:uncharacterized LabA/DUF88 family protein